MEKNLLTDEYPNRSKTAKTRQESEPKREKLESVVKAKRRVPKKTNKLVDLFVCEDIVNIREFLIREVAVPTLKDMAIGSLEMLFYGEYRGKKSRGKRKTDYTRASYEDDRYRERRNSDRSRRARFDFDSIGFDTRSEAEEVIDILCDRLEEYEYVTVGEFYDLVGIDAEATDDHWGWKDLTRVKAVRTRYDDWILSMPRPREVD